MGFLLDLGIEKPAYVKAEPTPETDLSAEHQALGMMISSSPLSFFTERISELKALSIDEASKKDRFRVAGVLKAVRSITNKSGNRMAFIEIYDDLNEMSFVCFKETYDESYIYLKEDAPLIIDGYLGKKGYVADKIQPLGEWYEKENHNHRWK